MIHHRNQSSAVLAAAALLLALGCNAALAQGSTGGSLGNDNKSLSGGSSRERSAPARRAKPERSEAPRRAARSGSGDGGGGVARFNGTWSVSSRGISCSDALTTTAVISNGRITSANDSGTISASGVSNTVGNYSGITVTATGRSSATAGSGTFQRSDGCHGRWTSRKQ